MVYIVNTVTGKRVARIFTNYSITLDEAIAAVGGRVVNDMSSSDWSDDYDNVIIARQRYCWDDLAVFSDADDFMPPSPHELGWM